MLHEAHCHTFVSRLRGITTGNSNHTGRATRIVAATLLLTGVMVAAYTVWALWFTALSADRAQDELRRRWTATVGAPSAPAPIATPLPDDSTTNTAPTDQATTAAGGSTAAGETVY